MNDRLAPYWRPEYARGLSGLLPMIGRDFEATKRFVQNPDNNEIVRDFTADHRRRFITEENRYVFLGNAPEEYVMNIEIRRRNIERAVDFVFENFLHTADTPMELNAGLAMRLLRIIGEEIIENTENYRVRGAAPAGYPIPYYLEPERIQDSIRQLFRDFDRPIEPDRNDWYVLASNFFRRFLFIHPFQDGNGRVSRILLSILLINYTITPLCLFSWKINSNNEFLRSLDEAHLYNNEELLRCFIIEAVHSNLERCRLYFGLDEE